MTFPTKGLSKRKQQAWLDANNPYSPPTIPGLNFEADFYSSQAKIFGAKADRYGKWAIGLACLAVVLNVAAVILRLNGL